MPPVRVPGAVPLLDDARPVIRVSARVALSFVAALAGLAAVGALEPVFSRPYFFPVCVILILPAVLAGARYGTLATLLLTGGFAVWFFEPRRTFTLASSADARALVGYVVTGTLLSLVGGKLRAVHASLREQHVRLEQTLQERIDLVRTLRENEQSLRQADQRKSEFLAMLSHELRNPLAPIRNSIYILDRAPRGSPQGDHAWEVIRRQTDHLTRLVNELLDVTRIERGKIELNLVRLDLAEVVRKTTDDLRSMFAASGLTVSVGCPAPVWVDADATRISQVLGNLLQNAVKFTPPGGSVSVSAGLRDGRGELTVRDTGVGMDEGELGRIFQPFAQADRTLARAKGGLGLGLALVKGVAELHGGHVRAQSAGIGKGTEFIVSLPLREMADPVTTGGIAPTTTSMGGMRVLVVDDNKDAAESLADILRMGGHEVDVAHDGPTALEKLASSAPEVVLCDIGLPGMNGYEVARRVRADAHRTVRLIALTGYAQAEDVRRATEAGFDAHVAKPPDPEKLARLIEQGRMDSDVMMAKASPQP